MMAKLNFQQSVFSVTWSFRIILLWWLGAQETFHIRSYTFSLGFFDKFVSFDKISIDFNQSINLTSSKHLNSSEV